MFLWVRLDSLRALTMKKLLQKQAPSFTDKIETKINLACKIITVM